MAWYYCPACKRKLQRGQREIAVAGVMSYCVVKDRKVKLRPVKRAATNG